MLFLSIVSIFKTFRFCNTDALDKWTEVHNFHPTLIFADAAKSQPSLLPHSHWTEKCLYFENILVYLIAALVRKTIGFVAFLPF